MIMQYVFQLMVAVNLVSAAFNRGDSQNDLTRSSNSYLLPRDADLATIDTNPDRSMMLLLARSAQPMDKVSNTRKARQSSSSRERNQQQQASPAASSSTPANQGSSSPKSPSARTPSPSQRSGKESPLRGPNTDKQPATSPLPRPQKDQRGRPLEVAQANVAREPQGQQSSRITAPPSDAFAQEALAKDTSKKLSLTRFSEVDPKQIEREHAGWFELGKNNVAMAERNAKAKAKARVRNVSRPARIYNELREARPAVKESRDQAKIHINAAADALYNRPVTSPTSRVRFALAGAATDRAEGIAAAYYNRENTAATLAKAESRWTDYPGHVKKAYKAIARHTAVEAHYNGLASEYQSKLDGDALSKIHPDHPEREKLVKDAVASRRDFHAAAKVYYQRDRQYREVRKAFVESGSSEEDEKEFPGVPRDKQ